MPGAAVHRAGGKGGMCKLAMRRASWLGATADVQVRCQMHRTPDQSSPHLQDASACWHQCPATSKAIQPDPHVTRWSITGLLAESRGRRTHLGPQQRRPAACVTLKGLPQACEVEAEGAADGAAVDLSTLQHSGAAAVSSWKPTTAAAGARTDRRCINIQQRAVRPDNTNSKSPCLGRRCTTHPHPHPPAPQQLALTPSAARDHHSLSPC